jgi:hypothetical protein
MTSRSIAKLALSRRSEETMTGGEAMLASFVPQPPQWAVKSSFVAPQVFTSFHVILREPFEL